MTAPVRTFDAKLEQHAAHKARQDRLLAAGDQHPAVVRLQSEILRLRNEVVAANVELESTRAELRASRDRVSELQIKIEEGRAGEGIRPWREVASEVCRKHGFSLVEIRGNRRFAPLVRARQELFYRLSSETLMSLPHIGRVCGDKDHTTVMHGIRRHAALLLRSVS